MEIVVGILGILVVLWAANKMFKFFSKVESYTEQNPWSYDYLKPYTEFEPVYIVLVAVAVTLCLILIIGPRQFSDLVLGIFGN
jgi:hypothetical protein